MGVLHLEVESALLSSLPENRDLYRDQHWRLVDLQDVLSPCQDGPMH